MADAFTANYNLVKPEINASRDTWGAKMHSNMDTIDTLLKAINDALITRLPAGIITMWNGAVPPAGWGLCDGSGGRPDFRDRFLICGGLSYGIGGVGGSTTHNHGGATLGHALTVAELASHFHGLDDPGHAHGYYDPGHQHQYNQVIVDGETTATPASGALLSHAYGGLANTGLQYTGITISTGYTGMGVQFTGGNAAHTHPISASNHLPPYYALAFIMKL